MAQTADQELVDRFEQFYRNYYREAIGELARHYPNEQRSLHVDWNDLYQFDPDLADDYLAQPDQLREYAEEALRVYDLPIDVSLGQAHVRIRNLPESTEIRDIRSRDVNTLVSVGGIVRKATDVRPKIEEAAFECQRCGTLTYIPQSGGFQEPHECQGCERQGPFTINYDQSTFIDAQKLRVQESPEGLRGGETPQSIDVNIEDDVTGQVSPGDRVTVTGVLRIEQQESGQSKSRMFDVYMDGHSVVIEDEEFESMDITDEDKQAIVELSEAEDVYERMVGSIAPSIYGFEEEKLAIILQLFSGVTKNLPDESRIRGDLHILLIGDPGTGKCLKGDTKITLSDGSEVAIGELVESNLDDPTPIDDGVYGEVDFEVPSLQADGTIGLQRATKVWKREAPETMYRVRTASGHEVEVTPSHPLFIQAGGRITARKAEDLDEGEFIAVPQRVSTGGDDSLDIDFRRSRSYNAVRLDPPDEWTPWLARLVGYIIAEGYVENRPDNTGLVSITNNDREVLDDAADALDRLGVNYSEREPHDGKDARELLCSSGELADFLERVEPAVLEGSARQRVPEALMRASQGIKSAFLKAYIEGEGHVSTKEREIAVASMSEELLEGVRSLLLACDIRSQLEGRKNGSYRLRISGVDFTRYVESIGFVTERKSVASRSFDDVPENTNTDVIPNVGDELRRIREALGLSQFDCGVPRTTYQRYERGDRTPSRGSLHAVIEAFEERLAWLRETRNRIQNGDWSDVEVLRREMNVSQRALADGMGVTQTAVSYYEREGAVPDGGRTTKAKDVILERIDDALCVADDVRALRALADGDVAWDRIESIEAVTPEYEWVYDLEVEGTHSYLSNGVISHNSQLLQYIRNVAPRSVYTSGKGSSAAGLCVTGDTRIHTTEGLKRIRDIAEREHPDPVTEDLAAERELGLYTFDGDTGEIDVRESSHVWRMPEKPCRRIETGHGKELEASENTPVLTCGERGMEWKPISDVEAGDYVAVPWYGDIERNRPPIGEYFEFTNEKIKLDDESLTLVRRRLYDRFGTLRDAAAELDVSEDIIYSHLWNRHVPLERLDTILNVTDTEWREVTVERAMLRHGNSVRVPDEFDEDLMYLIGLVFGDGDISLSRRGDNRGLVRISNSDEELLRRARDIIERTFDKRVEIEYQDDRVPCIRVRSATIARFFRNVGMRTPKDELALDDRLTTAENVDAFLRGLLDADGSVSARTSGGSNVHFSTISEELARQVQLMLETYGVRARVRERDCRGEYELNDDQTIETKHVQYHLELYGANIERYAEMVGFESVEKQTTLDRITDDATRRDETIPIAPALATVEGSTGQYWPNFNRREDPGRSRARAILDDVDLGDVGPLVEEAVEADLRWEEVVAAVDTGEKEVFDLTVPETHNFVGNGIVTHNTAAAVRDDFGEGQQWTLEAGALVLADRGIAAVDELDKMRCVTGETLVHTPEGITPIRELALRAAESGEIEELDNGRTVRDVDIEVWTMADDHRVVRRDVTALHEYDAPSQLREVTLESGESVAVTADHPFFTLEDGDRIEKPASELEGGDWVYVPESIPHGIADGGARVVEAGKASPDRGLTSAHGAILGYIAGDGNVYYNRKEGSYGIRFTNAEEELRSHFEQACRGAFDGATPKRHPSEQRDDGVGTVRLHGKAHVDELLDAGLNLETYEGKRVPEAVTSASKATKAAFVRALADSEGSVDERKVTITSSSYELLLGTKMLLSEFGVTSQIQTREREGKRDVYLLVITADGSLDAFRRHVGFTLDRKQRALESACGRTTGDRTIIDVLPECGDVFADARESLRLYQAECGLNDATYCNFENGDANFSFDAAETVLTRFETRREEAKRDLDALSTSRPCSWERLSELVETYHVTQHELAEGTEYSQPRISSRWGEDEELGRVIERRLETILEGVTDTGLDHLRTLVRGDVKWRRVTDVRPTSTEGDEARSTVLRHRLADLIGGSEDTVERRALDLLSAQPRVETWSELRDELERHDISFREVAGRMDVADSTVSRWFNRVVEIGNFESVREVCLDLIEGKRDRIRELLEGIESRRESKVYDLTVEGTHNFVANGMVVHNSEDRSAMHEALEQQSYHPDSEILLADGRRVEIGEFVDAAMEERSEEVIDGVECEILPVDDASVHSVDLDTNEVEKLPVDRVSRHEAPEEFVRVGFSNGRSVLVTPEHPMFVDDGEIGTVAAEDIEEGAFVPAPRKLPNSAETVPLRNEPTIGKEEDVRLPDGMSSDLAEILGLLIAEGHSYAGSSHEIGFSSQDDRLLARMEGLMADVFGMRSTGTTNAAGTVTKRWVSTKLYRWFESNVPGFMNTAREKRIPAKVLGASEEEIRRFLVGAFAGDGVVEQRSTARETQSHDGVESESMAFATSSHGLAEDYADALAKIGVASRIHYNSAEDSWKTYVMGDSIERFVEQVVDPADGRYEKARAFVERSNETRRHHDVLPTSVAREIRELRRLAGLGCTGEFRPNLDEGYGVRIETVERHIERLRGRIRDVRESLEQVETLAEVRAAIGWSGRQLADRLEGVTTSAIHYAESGGYDETKRERMATQARAVVREALDEAERRLDDLEGRCELRYYRVTEVETVPNEGEYATDRVYDVTVEPTNTFVSQGVVLHNSISISKAGINATLKSRCSLLGAANPKYGRFDQYEPIAEQIDLEPALVSRFDLIFTVTDQPDEERDRELAEHILRTNYAGELNTQRTELASPDVSAEEVEDVSETVEPAVDPELFRKYIAYAKRNVFPSMTEEAREAIRDFYVDLREEGTEEDAPVPVTARKLEALVRLAEASARVRLSDTVERRDAERVIDIVRSSLQDIGVDPETGQFDADVVETGTSKSQRDRKKTLRSLIEEIEAEYEEGAPVEEIISRAGEAGIDQSKVEHEIEQLKQKGELYEPSTNHLRTT